ncbi:DUF2183 domain-containing protein [Schumannella luteola]|uniref:Phosphatidate phosphatase APP1 n=1 Tax=Schumannella luteola TaxID=472059 RepID=A0A852YGC1_9MICO|nr:phosphatase domain-containing protein [Schumannella luteola]NYH00355.1 phosphatidate phosphatase APP1 [Schumannella luteola]TPX05960.1 DUF2183 domain-containing protein [Schumannella luteola]
MPEPTHQSGGARSVPHLAARAEDAFHAFRERWGRRRGLVPRVIPFSGYGSAGWVRVLARVVLAKPGRPRGDRVQGARGWRSFTAIPLTHGTVTVTVGGVDHRLTADRGGVVDARLTLDLPPGWNSIQISAEGEEPIEAEVFVIDPAARFGIVSDVDDTVMVTALPRPFLAAWNTFVLNEHARRPVPGMPVLYERLTRQHPGTPVIYLSTGAWNVAPTLTRFLGRNLYPRGALLLTDWGPTHDRWFRSGQAHKRGSLRRLAEELPNVRWLLVGDDGQHDEELYAEFAREHPESVAAIAIRQLTPGEAVLAGGRSTAEERGTAAQWRYAPDGAGLSEQLGELGLLR